VHSAAHDLNSPDGPLQLRIPNFVDIEFLSQVQQTYESESNAARRIPINNCRKHAIKRSAAA